ncbi:TonB-dependent receptor [Echinicola marina]|uniref:SusC/RagA family TonB-linked outer membrane protein n=1 Tax=Echinicola marina TaxID=2859768 RepID=UPI001CF68FDC|nr:TonB-dependent receptor [Echinicola marina]UCS91705.1 TonB-dependent receptor [Echinicola marina]
MEKIRQVDVFHWKIGGKPISILITLAFLIFVHSSMSEVKAQQLKNVQISIDAAGKSTEDVLSLIEKKTDLTFVYDPNEIGNHKVKVTKNFTNSSLQNILDDLQLQGEEKGKHVIIHKKSAEVTAVEKSAISGIVSDTNGEPLPGASVLIEGEPNKGTVTDIDGSYSIDVDQGKTLIFSYIGFETKKVVVGAQSEINVVLEVNAESLDEVVVVGFGTQKEYSVVGSVTTIKPDKLQLGTSRSLSNNLAGQLSGVIAAQRSGEPGYDNSQFWIRGISTFAGNRSPLILVDGVQRSLDNIDPAEIASFSILKDAAASAVYGVRGANGVIIINTKRGHVGKPTVDIRYERGITQPVKLPDFVGAADYLGVLNSISEESGKPKLFSEEKIEEIRSGADPDLSPDVNWLDEITRDYASNNRVNLTVSGGSDVLKYAFVGSYYGEDGILSRDESQSWDSSIKLRRYNVRSNIDLNVTPTTLMRVNIGGYLQDRNTPPQSIDDLFNKAFEIPPYVHPTQYSSGEIPVTPQRSNPWALATQRGYERHSSSKLESLFSLEQDLSDITEGLEMKLSFSFDRYSGNSVSRSKSPDYYNPATGRNEDGTLDLVIYQYGQDFLGYSTGSDWGNKSVYLEGNLNYRRNFEKHYVDAMFMYNQRHYDSGDRLPFRTQGIAGRLSYSYDRRYIAEVNFGYNGSENFAKGQRFGFFPSVAVGWVVSEEDFLTPYKETLSKLKLRASMGLVGNDQIDGRRFAYITTIGDTGGYSWGIENNYSRSGRREGDYGVENLTWETVMKSNIGIELGLWNSLDLRVDLFKEQRRDIFMQRRTIPGSAGYINTPWANFGKVNNKGIDMSLDYSKQVSPNVYVSVRGTFTYAKNKIIEQDEPSSVVGTPRSSTGQPVGQLFGLIAEGLFKEEDFLDVEEGILMENIPSQTYGLVRPGDIRYKDLNDDGVINDLDKTAIGGTVDPQMVYGFGSNIRYKNFDFGLFFQANSRTWRVIGDGTTYFIPGSGAGALGNIFSNVDDRWTVENPRQDVFWPRLADYVHTNNNQASTWWLRDMSMVRLRNVELGYNFSKQMLSKAKLGHARVFVRGNNLATFSKFDLWDPELGSNNGFRYPIMKSFSIGANINF